jgi:hypothetical protein
MNREYMAGMISLKCWLEKKQIRQGNVGVHQYNAYKLNVLTTEA